MPNLAARSAVLLFCHLRKTDGGHICRPPPGRARVNQKTLHRLEGSYFLLEGLLEQLDGVLYQSDGPMNKLEGILYRPEGLDLCRLEGLLPMFVRGRLMWPGGPPMVFRGFMCRLELGEPAMSARGPPVSPEGLLYQPEGIWYQSEGLLCRPEGMQYQ